MCDLTWQNPSSSSVCHFAARKMLSSVGSMMNGSARTVGSVARRTVASVMWASSIRVKASRCRAPYRSRFSVPPRDHQAYGRFGRRNRRVVPS